MGRVLTIPPGAPFLPALADALAEGRLGGGSAGDGGPGGEGTGDLAAATIYLPTRRAAAAFTALLAERLCRESPADGAGAGPAPRPALLPAIVAFGDADESEFDLAESPGAAEGDAGILAPPLAPLQRRLILGRLVQAWRGHLAGGADAPGRGAADARARAPASPAEVLALTGELERLTDALTVADVSWDDLGAAVESEYSRYFSLTLDFVRIAAENWPRILAERGASDPAARARERVLSRARRLADPAAARPAGPVIVAGSTGSQPATERLLAAVAALPDGAVVLPGLDLDLDEAGWAAIRDEGEAPAHGHPQTLLRRLLDALDRPRAEVAELGAPAPGLATRARLLSQAMRPAETTEAWATLSPRARAALAREGLAGVALVEAADEREEALAAALALREALEVPGRTTALITPDAGLAARVAAELGRWGIRASAGAANLAASPAGVLARLAAECAAHGAAPLRLLALLAHPLARLGLPRARVERAAAVLEIGVLRGPAPAPGFAGIAAALVEARERGLSDARPSGARRPPLPARRLAMDDWACAVDLVARLAHAFADFAPGDDPGAPRDLAGLAEAHRVAVEHLLAGPEDEPEDEPGDVPEDGSTDDPADDPADASRAALDALFDDLALAAPRDPFSGGPGEGIAGRFAEYPAFFAALARERLLPDDDAANHPRLHLLDPLAARLLSFDRVVLGGLDEGVWPPRAQTDAFLNRPMRARVGLPPPERRVGQSAHDFAQAMGAPEVVLTRARKREGGPTVPSRFVQRLRAFAGEEALGPALAAGERLRRLAALLDGGGAPGRRSPPAARPVRRPAPRPDPALFPAAMSVTEVETLLRDPYAVFARRVLRLEPLDPVAVVPGASDRGTLVHAVLGNFATDFPAALPPDARAHLLRCAADAFAPLAAAHPDLYAEWWPRFERLATNFLAWEVARRPDLARVHAEVAGRWALPGTGDVDGSGPAPFVLSARADRIEHGRDGAFAVIDLKTGAVPSAREVFAGLAPQLTLEAAMLMAGAFRGVPRAATVPDLVYLRAGGGRAPMEARPVRPPAGEARGVDALVAEQVAALARLVAQYRGGERGYVSRPFPKRARADGPYDHLARVREWSLAAGGDEEVGA